MTAREVRLEGGAPWGFRMHGGVDQNQPLKISRVNPGSKAALRGIREGDFISSINGQSTKNLSNVEAHGLLRNAGDTLNLGLNKDPDGSPKRRQYRTVQHQESYQETVKKSSITTYSSIKTVESVETPSDKSNESKSEKIENTSINGASNNIPPSNLLVTKKPSSSTSSSPTLTKDDFKSISSDNAFASHRSSYTNCTLSPSSPSILSEDGICSCAPSHHDYDSDKNVTPDTDNMNSSRSRRRRQRRKNQNSKITESNCDENPQNTTDKAENVLPPEEYTVQSPVELSKNSKDTKKTKPIKSRSLDDDEMVNIQEVSATEIDDKEDKDKETQAIISEASESEVEWEETETLDTPPPIHGTLSTFTLPLEGCISEQINLISPEEEKTLRDFLGGLNLVNGPEEAAQQAYDKTESTRERKARKKAELEKYFLPIYQNPRYLDVISEESRESSDRDSDREQSKTNLNRVLRKETPDITPPKVPPRPNRKKLLNKINSPIEQASAVLVDAKIVDTTQSICNTIEKETASNVEVVYLTSSETDSAEESESRSSDSYTLVSEKDSSNEDVSKTVPNTKTDVHKSDTECNNNSKPNEIDTTITTSTYKYTVKTDKNEDIVNIDVLNELTPPPTPENHSPNDTNNKYKNNTEINILSSPPPPSKSSSSSRSSSRGSSLCTAKYNPSASSINDVIKLADEVDDRKYQQPLSLREICVQYLLSLPFGKEMLQELADVSKCIDSYTKSLPSSVLPKLIPNIAQINSRSHNNTSYNLSVQLPSSRDKVGVEDLGRSDMEGKNSGLKRNSVVEKKSVEVNIPIKIEKDTDSRKEIRIPIKIEDTDNVIKERLIPMKTKGSKEFVIPITIEKEKSNDIKADNKSKNNNKENNKVKEVNIPIRKEWVALPTETNPKVLVCLSPKQKDELDKSKPTPDEAAKLLDLHEKFINRKTSYEEIKETKETKETKEIKEIRECNDTSSNTQASHSNRLLSIIKEEPIPAPQSEDNYIYFVEKDPFPVRHNKARLNANSLTEWLNLARNKSVSESNLTTAPDIPENNLRNCFNMQASPLRRTSLPQDIFEKQMIYIQEKEREIQRELENLEEEKRRLNAEMAPSRQFHADDYYYSRKGDFAESKKRLSMPVMPTEYFRQQMYEEYMDKFAEREERRQHKIIKVTSSKDVNDCDTEKKEIIHPIQIEDEFMSKVKELQKVGKLEKVKSVEKDVKNDAAANDDEPPVLVMDGEELKVAKELPKHLQEFVDSDGIWSPGQKLEFSPKEKETGGYESQQDESIPPVWTPKSANSSPIAERKEFRPVNFQSPVLGRRNRTTSENIGSKNSPQNPPWKPPDYNSDTGSATSILERRLPTSRSTPATGFSDFSSTSRLPKAQNPTITLLQKAREGQLPKGALYIDQDQRNYRPRDNKPPIAGPGEILYQIKNEYTSESDNERPRKMTDLGPRKFEGIGPVSKDGLPLVLRSEVKDQNQSKWYKRMYETIHKQKPHNDEYVTIRYKQKRAQYPYTSGYLSEPEPGAYDSDFTDYKYQTLDRRRPPLERSSEYINSTMPRPSVNRSSSSDIVRNTQDSYKSPGKIENYVPGRSSIAEKEAKQWWDEVMDIFDGHLEQQKKAQFQPNPKSFMNQCLKETGYDSDSTLVFRRKEEAANQLSPKEQREAYKVIQKGGDVPLHGLRKPAPEKPKETEYVEFYPISPTLTRIRIHKNIKPIKEVFCYPVTVHHDNTFSAYKRTAPSSVIPSPPPIPPPSPPRRKSSRNNPTLRLVSTMKVKTSSSPLGKRHETCFTTTSDINRNKVNYLKDRISCKLSPTSGRRSASPKIRIVKKVSASPELKDRITSTISTSRDKKTRKVESKTNIQRSKSSDSVPKTSKKSPINSSVESLNLFKPHAKTFGANKKKFELNIKPTKLVKSPDLVSPTEVKKATLNLPSKKYLSKSKDYLPTNTNINTNTNTKEKDKTRTSTNNKIKRVSTSPIGSSSTKTKSSLESLSSPKTTRKTTSPKPKTNTQKSKKEKINGEIRKDTNKTPIIKKAASPKTKPTCTSILNDIRKQKTAIETNHFFQNLFLRGLSPTPPTQTNKSSWLVEKTNQLHRRRSSFPEPSISAMKIYLQHTRPVSDSKFISLDMATMRSRSASPRTITFSDNIKEETKRSSSLPPKLIFSQTTRPVSPVVHHKKLVSPPPSPKLCRSPSCRRIMQYKNQQLEKSKPELSLYTCPSINHSTTSLDSFKSDDSNISNTRHIPITNFYDRFKDLNHFYSEIEKVGKLERVFSVKPRRKNENEIIDFDRWKEVRTRERAERELKYLHDQIKKEEKDKGFLYIPKDVRRFKWKKDYDIGLKIKEKSVDDIKEEFEKIKLEEKDYGTKKQELAFLKDTYKPLWRGFSVASIASCIGERRSHSEGRAQSVRQKLIESENFLNHGIGSRIWSSLSMEQVNLLKEQLAQIYDNYSKTQDYTVHVPKEKAKYVPKLTVRRNSDSSEHIYHTPIKDKPAVLSESEKKMMSYNLSKELLNKIAKRRKENLPIVVGKEVLGAVAAAAADTPTKPVDKPCKPLIKTDAVNATKAFTTSETESGSTDESSKTVICVPKEDDIKKKVEYFEHIKEQEPYIPTIYKPADNAEEIDSPPEPPEPNTQIQQSKSCQSLKEYFGEKELVKFATIPLSATRKQKFTPKQPELRSIDFSPIRSVDTSNESIYSRSISPYIVEKPPIKTGEVNRLKSKFELIEDMYGSKSLKRSKSESDLHNLYPNFTLGHVDTLRRKYEYPAYSGRGRSRTRKGGVVSPIFLKAEDRFMPHINIISKIASLYTKKGTKNGTKKHRSIEELAEILGCPIGEVEKLREKFDSQEDISIMGHMYTSSPSIKELRDIAPYLTADWTAHRYPKFEDNTRSLSSPEHSIASRDTSFVKRDKSRPKSTSPLPKPKPVKSLSILKPVQKSRSTDFFKNQKYDPKIHEPVARYQPSDVTRYKNGWSVCSKPTVSFKEPEPPVPPVPPPKGQYARNLEQESPRKYVENEVTIHYKTPVRQEIKDYLSEDELAHRQAEAMKKIYQEERRKKYLQVSKSLQELQDMNSRRHTDNFIPSQKSPISLNRYDDFDDLAPTSRPRPRSPEHRLCARALYNFVGQSARELTFRKGDIIYLRRQIDKNWYEGELNAMIGLFPANYVEIIPFEGTTTKTTLRKAHEGQARAKFNFVAQTHLELSLAKGELVVITRKVDDNWYEGKIGGRKGIFPANYVDILIDPQTPPPQSSKPVAAPASHSLLLNGSSGGKESMGSHSYTPSLPNTSQLTSSYRAKPVQVVNNSLHGKNLGINQTLHIETQSEPVPYRAMYKYKPQNEDELELLEGDTVYVLEKCDDGWYVGSSERTGAFGTFPGNYVEKI